MDRGSVFPRPSDRRIGRFIFHDDHCLSYQRNPMDNIIAIAQIVISVILILLILLQQRGTALGSAFGQDGGGGAYTTQRGLQKKIFWATITVAGLFLALAIANLVR